MTGSLSESLGGNQPNQWAADFLKAIGAPTSNTNLSVVIDWMNHESGGGGGLYNPLNTTLVWPGSTPLNSVGVQNYQSWKDGIAASAQTFTTGRWLNVAKTFQTDAGAQSIEDAIDAVYHTWGAPSIPWDQTLPDPGPIDPGAAEPASPVPIPGNPGGLSQGNAGDCPEGVLFKMNLGVVHPTITRCQGRAMLGAVCVLGGGLLVLTGIAFALAGTRAGRQIVTLTPGLRPA